VQLPRLDTIPRQQFKPHFLGDARIGNVTGLVTLLRRRALRPFKPFLGLDDLLD
jgi:hypothetical protein